MPDAQHDPSYSPETDEIISITAGEEDRPVVTNRRVVGGSSDKPVSIPVGQIAKVARDKSIVTIHSSMGSSVSLSFDSPEAAIACEKAIVRMLPSYFSRTQGA